MGKRDDLSDRAYRIFVRQCREARAAKSKRAKPWMKIMEIEIVRDLLLALQPKNCLEWGAGYSTIEFSCMITPVGSWLSVEHNRGWAKKIREKIDWDGVTIEHVKPNRLPPWSDKERDGTASDLADYIAFPEKFSPFNFILIDGRARAACLDVAPEYLAPGGVVVLHDADRLHYAAAIAPYEHQVMFRFRGGDRTRGGRGFWVGSVDRPIEKALDVLLHRRIWSLHEEQLRS